MTCNKCGREIVQGAAFCPHCGERLFHEATISTGFSTQILQALKDPLFLVVCILMSASCLMALSAGSVPLINILITVFLWLTYAQARKDIADANHLRSVSGAVYAYYVIYYVVAGIVLVSGVILAIALSALSSSQIMETLKEALAEEGIYIPTMSMAIPGAIILVACAIAAAIIVVVNIFTYRYLHRFAKSVYRSIEQNIYAVEYAKAAKIFLFVLGGLTAIGCLSDLASNDFNSFLSDASNGGCAIVAGLLVRKYLSDPEN